MRSSAKEKKRVMVFGVFDGLHEGHRDFLRQAGTHGDELVVVVARDSAVRALKDKSSHEDEETRRTQVAKDAHVHFAVLGDEAQGSYAVIARHEPNLICLGYDQEELGRDLKIRMAKGVLKKIRIKNLSAFEPEHYHSSLF